MLSVSKGMSLRQAERYFSREDYLLKGYSRWVGTGAEALGLVGSVSKVDFCALCKGEDPRKGAQIVVPKVTKDKQGRRVETHRAGCDLVFSAPKSVSIAYVVSVPGIKEAFDAALDCLTVHLEAHYCHVRCPGGIAGGGLLAARFDHATSENIDPLLHTHLFLMNAALLTNATWRATELKALYLDQKSVGLLFRQQLAYELGQRGFEILITDRSQLFFEIKGVDDRLVKHFSSRRKEILTLVGSWEARGKFPKAKRGKLYEMASLETLSPRRKIIPEDVLGLFELGFTACGSSGEEVRALLDCARNPDPGSLPGTPVEGDADRIIRLAAREEEGKAAALDRARLLDQAALISLGRHCVKNFNAALDGGWDGIKCIGRDPRGRAYYVTEGMQLQEGLNWLTLWALKGSFHSVTRFEEIDAFLRRFALREGVRLTPGQRRHVRNELAGEPGVAVTRSDPGAGLIFAIEVVEMFNRDVLRPQGKEHFAIDVALLGSTALELKAAGDRPNLSREGLQMVQLDAGLDARQGAMEGGRPVSATLHIPPGAQVILRFPKAGLASERQIGTLLQAVRHLQAQGFQAKLQLCGRTAQMQAIQAGELSRQAQEFGERKWISFTHLAVSNGEKDSELVAIDGLLDREDRVPGGNFRKALALLRERGALIEQSDRQELVALAVEWYLSASSAAGKNSEMASGEKRAALLVTATDSWRRQLNQEIRKARVAAGEILEGNLFQVLVPVHRRGGADGYRLGDTVIFSGFPGEDGRLRKWGVRLHTVGTVTGFRTWGNTVTVSYTLAIRSASGLVNKKRKTRLPAAEMARKTTLVREEQRSFAPGDRVITLNDDKVLGIRAGWLGLVVALEGTRCLIDFGGTKITVDLASYRHLEHAYAVSADQLLENVIERICLVALEDLAEQGDSPPGGSPDSEESFGRACQKALKVVVARALYDIYLLTDSVSGLTRALVRS
jgi:conjugative relaxase-like TrwC/TraI family protein